MRLAFKSAIDALLLAEDELCYIDPKTLSQSDKARHARAIANIGKLVDALIAARLGTLTAAGKKTVGRIVKATEETKSQIEMVTNALQMLNVVTQAINTVASLVKLL